MKNCIISANCQAVPLAKQLITFYPFACEYEIEIFTNFTKTIIPLEKLQNCDLLIYQKLGLAWGNLSEKFLLENVNPKAKVICMPNIVNTTLWPTSKHTGNLIDSYRDSFVEELITRKLAIKEILYLVEKKDYATLCDINEIMRESIAKEREKKYLCCDLICDYIMDNYKTTQLFTTINHPYGKLLNLVAKLVLEEIGFSQVPDSIILNLNCDDDFDLPIHPSVSKFLGLSYGGHEQLYNVYGKMLTYNEYLYAYVYARLNEIPLTYFLMNCKKA